MNLMDIILDQQTALHLPRHDHSITILLVMDGMEKKAFVDLKVHQDTEENLDIQDHQEIKDLWVIEVQMVSLEELVLLV